MPTVAILASAGTAGGGGGTLRSQSDWTGGSPDGQSVAGATLSTGTVYASAFPSLGTTANFSATDTYTVTARLENFSFGGTTFETVARAHVLTAVNGGSYSTQETVELRATIAGTTETTVVRAVYSGPATSRVSVAVRASAWVESGDASVAVQATASVFATGYNVDNYPVTWYT